jgi:hypothetical protein
MSWKKSDEPNNKDDSINTKNNKESIQIKQTSSVANPLGNSNDKFMLDEIVKVIKNNKDGYTTIAPFASTSSEEFKKIVSTKAENNNKEKDKDKINNKPNSSNEGTSR